MVGDSGLVRKQRGRWAQRPAASPASEGRGKASTTQRDDRQRGRWGQRAGPSAAREARGKASTTQSDDRQRGRWGQRAGPSAAREARGKAFTTQSDDRQRGRWGQRPAASPASEARGKVSTTQSDDRQSGRWGVGQACEFRSILDVIATLIEAQRPDLAMILIEGEMNSQKKPTLLSCHRTQTQLHSSSRLISGDSFFSDPPGG